MPHTHDEVVAVVQKAFPEGAHTRVLELLGSYNVESYERAREQVRDQVNGRFLINQESRNKRGDKKFLCCFPDSSFLYPTSRSSR
jgi:hypothetical protein